MQRARSTSRIVAAGTLVAFGLTSACGARQTTEPTWTDVREVEGDGRLAIENRSERPLTRIWLVASRGQALNEGGAPEAFERLEPGATFEAPIPMGWWDIWLEAETGEDVVLFQSWFSASQPTTLVVEDSWWQLGDWVDAQAEGIGTGDDAVAP